MGDRPSRQGLNDIRVLGEGLNGMRIRPPSSFAQAWNDEPERCEKCSLLLQGAYFDHPSGYFCSLECAEGPLERFVSYREAVLNDPFLALREAMRGTR